MMKNLIVKILKRKFCSLILCCIFFSFNVFSQIKELDNYLKIAAENNPGLKAKFNEYMAAMQRVPQVGALPDPQIAFAYFIVPVETRVGPQNAKISLSQKFPWFGLLNSKKDVATELAKAKFEAFEEAKSNLFYELKSTYYDYYFNEKSIQVTKEIIKILETYKELALVKFEAGQASLVDELRLEMELNELNNNLKYFYDMKKSLVVKFYNLLNVNNTGEILIPSKLDTLNITSLHNVVDSIIVNNHNIKRLDYMINTWKNKETVARKEGMPDFNIGIDYTFIGQSSNPEMTGSGKDAILFPKIAVSIPLYRKKYNVMLKEASYKLEASQQQKTDKQNLLKSTYEMVLKDFLDARRRVKLYESQQKLAKQALDILLATYTTDAKDFEEVLRMERKYLNYSLKYYKAIADQNTSVAFIEYLQGK